jgi:hypothetical protein
VGVGQGAEATFGDELARPIEGQGDVQVAGDVARVDVQVVGLDAPGARVGAKGPPARVLSKGRSPFMERPAVESRASFESARGFATGAQGIGS